MKIKNSVILISFVFALAVILATAVLTDTWPGNGFFLMAGVIAMFGGAGYLLLGLLLLFLKNKQYAYGLFTSAAVLMVSGFIVFKLLPNY